MTMGSPWAPGVADISLHCFINKTQSQFFSVLHYADGLFLSFDHNKYKDNKNPCCRVQCFSVYS